MFDGDSIQCIEMGHQIRQHYIYQMSLYEYGD